MATIDEQFLIMSRPQREWSWLIAIAFFLAGVGGGLFLLSLLVLDEPGWGLAVSIAVVALGTNAAFLLDLGRPTQFWRAMTHPSTSWISRGVLIIMAFLGLAFLYALPFVGALSELPWREGTALGGVLKVAAAAAALGVMVYSGFVLSYSPAIPFWNTTLLPILFVLYGGMAGTGATFVMLPWLGESAVDIRVLETVEIYLLLAALALITVYLLTMFNSSAPARESTRMLLKGGLSRVFLGGVVSLGLLVPLAVAVLLHSYEADFSTAAPVLAIVGLLELGGGLLFRYCLIKAGVRTPVM